LVVLAVPVGAGVLRRYFWELYCERVLKVTIPKLLREVIALLVFVVVLLAVLGFVYDIKVTGFLFGSSGILALVLGFAMQDLLGNIIAGMAVQIGKPYKEGDWLKVNEQYGEVIEINWRSTRLRTNDHITLDIPNSQIVRNTIVNLCYPTAAHAMRMRLGLEYDATPQKVKAALLHAARRAPGVLADPPVKIFLVDFADSAVIYEIKFSMDDHSRYNETCDAIRTRVWYELRRAGLRIPFPIRTIDLPWRREQSAGRPESHAMEVLRQRPLMALLDDAQFDRLIAGAAAAAFGDKEEIIEQGAEGDSMFVLVEGRAAVFVEAGGAERRVATLQPGDFFGEISMLTGEARSATVRAEGDCQVIEIGKELFSPILEANPGLMEKISGLLARRKMETEGLLATASQAELHQKERDYASGFLERVRRFFVGPGGPAKRYPPGQKSPFSADIRRIGSVPERREDFPKSG
jgi:small-conductance mechanosensitive channel/CRP-like cAMP-binding protein